MSIKVWEADLQKMNEVWGGESPIRKIEDAFSVRVELGKGLEYTIPLHLFGDAISILPYYDSLCEDALDADGNSIGLGDSIIAEAFPLGEIGFAIKHHSPAYRLLNQNMAREDNKTIKECIKLQDTHIQLVIGVHVNGLPGAITLNSPQDYCEGRFGPANYPMVFVSPEFPDYVTSETKASFRDNIRTMMALFSTVANFPGNYNGGDPLAVQTPENVKEHVKHMILGLAGDDKTKEESLAWFEQPEHLIYCAELAHVATTSGLLMPLNERHIVPLVGDTVWSRFQKIIELHNCGKETPILTLNKNKLVKYVELALAPSDLKPMAEYAPEDQIAEERNKLAFKPMTTADILDYAIRAYFPREKFGESMAKPQAAVMHAMKPGLMEILKLDDLSDDDPKRKAFEDLYQQFINVIGKEHESYNAFRTALEPLMNIARELPGPRPNESSRALFVPPSLLHLTAQGSWTGGLLGLKYVGHGLHSSLVRCTSS